MNIAFLIAAHKDEQQLFRLVKKLLTIGDIYVHIDKKTTPSVFENFCNYLFSDYQNHVYVINNQINVARGGYSQVKWIEECLRSALMNKSVKYDRFFTLSGLDYPLWSTRKIMDYCTAHPDEQWFTVWNISKSKDKRQQKKVRYYHLFRDIPLPHNSFWRRAIIVGSRLLLRGLGFRKPLQVNIDNQICDVYVSSEWFSITRPCAEYVIKQLTTNKSLVHYFQTSYAPDELVFATCIMASPYKKGIDEVIGEMSSGLVNRTKLHYIEYAGKIFSYSLKDYDKLMKSGKMFVRKLESGLSESLIAKIDEANSETNMENSDKLNF